MEQVLMDKLRSFEQEKCVACCCCCCCRHNGKYVQTHGLMEQVLMDKLLAFVKQREKDGE
jgi:hypothetical protein